MGLATSVSRGAGVWAFVLVIVTAGALGHVGVRLKGLEVAYDLGRERRIATDLEEQRRRLQIEIGMLKDPRRVVSIARDKLNMGPPAPDAIRRLGSGALWAASAPHALAPVTKNPAGTRIPGPVRNVAAPKDSPAGKNQPVAKQAGGKNDRAPGTGTSSNPEKTVP